MPDNRGGDLYRAPEADRTWLTRLIGVGVLLVVCALLCCQLTYHPEQVSWSLLNPAGHEKAADIPCTNLLGVCGMYLAGLLYHLLGIAAVYGTLLLIAPACGMVLNPSARRMGQWVALGVMLITACTLMAVQPWFFIRWAESMQVTTPAGKLGYLLGPCITEALLGGTWAVSLMLLVHAVALIYYARLTPSGIYRTEKKDIADTWQRWREGRQRNKLEKEAAARSWQSSLPQVQQELPHCSDTFTSAPPRDDSRFAPPAEAPRRYAPERPAPETPSRYAPDPRDYSYPDDTPPSPAEPPRYAPKPEPELPAEEPRYAPRHTPEPPAPKPAREAPQRDPRRPVRLGQPGNLLDLMPPVEDEEDLERLNSAGIDEDDYMPINPHTLEALNRLNGIKPEPAPATSEPPSPRRTPAAPATPPRPAMRREEAEDTDYPLPPYELLNYEPPSQELRDAAQEEMAETQAVIADTLESFRISVEPGEITRGPSITRYEFAVLRGQSVKAVVAKKNDLMAATRSASVNILAPIPGKSTVGIELQNSVSEPVYLRELLQSEEFHNPKMRLPVALGKNVYGKPVIGDLAAMPHVLVAGTTGSGKSVCINSMLISLLYKFRPDELKLILIDPKQVEMQPYKKLPHLAVPVVTDPARVIGALRWATNEMEQRYSFFSRMGVRNLEDFNKLPPDAQPVQDEEEEMQQQAASYPENDWSDANAIVRDIEGSQGIETIPEEEEQAEMDFNKNAPSPSKLPYIVIVVDELADLMLQVKEDLENYIGRLTQKARAAGIHLVVATQTPRSQVVTGTIKTNLPCRIALKVSSQIDSRVILDEVGAENLLGKGDLLFLPPGGPSKMTRAQGAFVSDAEISSIIKFCASHAKQSFVQSATAALNEDPSTGGGKGGRGSGGAGDAPGMDEELYTRCVNLVVTERKASTTLLQRRFRIGYAKAAEIMELMEKRGVVSPSTGSSRPREVLIEAP